MIRKKYIDYESHYFITVNVLIRKSFVSLGGNCAVTYNLNKLGLRNKAFAFDWSKNKLFNIIDVYKSKFKDFSEVNIVKYSDMHNSYLVKNKYMTFAHEVVSNDNINKFKEQLERRIKRTKRIENPVFVRIETFSYKNVKMYRKYWLDLIKLLDKKYDDYHEVKTELSSLLNNEIYQYLAFKNQNIEF
jgi:hypothetical protein